jgi:N-hydroxyarylamine O-acetyltransferase
VAATAHGWEETRCFTQGTICSRLTEEGRISISGQTLIRTSGTARTEEELAGTGALLDAYRDHFGITLDKVPGAGAGRPAASGLAADTAPHG